MSQSPLCHPLWVYGGELTASQLTEPEEEVGLILALSQKLSNEAVAG